MLYYIIINPNTNAIVALHNNKLEHSTLRNSSLIYLRTSSTIAITELAKINDDHANQYKEYVVKQVNLIPQTIKLVN